MYSGTIDVGGGALCFENTDAAAATGADAVITACTFTGNSTKWTGPPGPEDVVFGGAVLIQCKYGSNHYRIPVFGQ